MNRATCTRARQAMWLLPAVALAGLWVSLRKPWKPSDPPKRIQATVLHRISPELAAQVAAIDAREQAIRETVWAPEVLAQECGRTLEDWWDTLNAATNRLAAAATLAVGEVTWPTWGPPVPVLHGIRIRHPDGPGVPRSTDAWRDGLQALDAAGWRLHQTEVRQVLFEPDANGAPGHSVFTFTAHLTNGFRIARAALEGDLTVHWDPIGTAGERVGVRRLDASRIRLAIRDGLPAFVPWLEQEIEPPVNAVSVDPLIVQDLDGDGRPEVVLAGRNQVWRLGGDGQFRAEPLAREDPGLLYAALMADFDGDGVVDFLCLRHEGLRLFRGSVGGRFDAPGLLAWPAPRELRHPMAFTCGDMDGDGDLDLFIGQYKQPYVAGSMPTPCDDARDGHPAYLLRNEGDGRFTDITAGSGLEPKRRRRAYSASFCDLDGDGSLDLVVVSDFAGLDLHHNDGNGRFEDVTARWVAEPSGLGMGHVFSDFNADGWLDLLMIGMNSPTVDRLEHLGLWRPHPALDRSARTRLTYGNRLWLSHPDGGFAPTALNDSIARTGWSWGGTAADFDNDGWPDVAIVNGMESRESVRDIEPEFWLHDLYVGNSGDDPAAHLHFRAKVDRTQGRGHSYGGHEKNRLLMNRAGRSFLEVGHLFGVALEEDTRNIVSADLDGDGRADLVVLSFDRWPSPRQKFRIFRNTLPAVGAWVGFHLRGDGSSVLGSRVTVEMSAGRASRVVVTGDSHRSQHPATVHFGLGDLKHPPSEATIHWASGAVTRIPAPEPGRYHDVQAPTRPRRP